MSKIKFIEYLKDSASLQNDKNNKLTKNTSDLFLYQLFSQERLKYTINPEYYTTYDITEIAEKDLSIIKRINKNTSISNIINSLNGLSDQAKKSLNIASIINILNNLNSLNNKLNNYDTFTILSSALMYSSVKDFESNKQNNAETISLSKILQIYSESILENPNHTPAQLFENIRTIYKNTPLSEQINSELAFALVNNKEFTSEEILSNGWITVEKPLILDREIGEYDLNTESQEDIFDINNIDELKKVLQNPTFKSYQSAIEYLKEIFNDDASNNDLKNYEPGVLENAKLYKTYIATKILAVELNKDKGNLLDFQNIFLSLIIKDKASEVQLQPCLEDVFKQDSKGKENYIRDLKNEAIAHVEAILGIEKTNNNNNESDDNIEPVEEDFSLVNESNTKQELSPINRNQYIDHLLKNLPFIKTDSQKKKVRAHFAKIIKGKKASAQKIKLIEETLNIHPNCILKVIDKIKPAIIDYYSPLRNSKMIFNDGMKKEMKKSLLNSSSFSPKINKDSEIFDKEQWHEILFKEFFELLQSDTALLNNQTSYRQTPAKILQIELKDRVKKDSRTFPLLNSYFTALNFSELDYAKKVVFDKYIDIEGNKHEEYQDLYRLFFTKSSLEERKKAHEVVKPLLSEEENTIIENYFVKEIEKEQKSKTEEKTDEEKASE